MNEIDIMRKEIWNHVSVEMGEQMDKLCETIYAGKILVMKNSMSLFKIYKNK